MEEEQVKQLWLAAYIGGPLLMSIWGWLSGRIPQMLASLISKRLMAALKGAGVEDEDVRKYVQQITYATVILAEAKFPDKGMGKDKYKLVFGLLSKSFPFLKGFLKSQGTYLEEIINKTVIEMDRSFKHLKQTHKKLNLVVPLPVTPEHRLKPEG